jgi:hypothetical protein
MSLIIRKAYLAPQIMDNLTRPIGMDYLECKRDNHSDDYRDEKRRDNPGSIPSNTTHTTMLTNLQNSLCNDLTRGFINYSTQLVSDLAFAKSTNDVRLINDLALARSTNDSCFIGNFASTEKLPDEIVGTYSEDYNILYIHDIILKKLANQKINHLTSLRKQLIELKKQIMQPQTYIAREKALRTISELEEEIKQIESDKHIEKYENLTRGLLERYRKHGGKIKTITFEKEDKACNYLMDEETREHINIIEKYIEIAKDYIHIDLVRIYEYPTGVCIRCGTSVADVATNEDGIIICPNEECGVEHNSYAAIKVSKDNNRINTYTSTEDETIDNFLKAFVRYQGLESDRPDESLYEALDVEFAKYGRPSGAEIRKLPLNSRGRRGDTNHKMLLKALSDIRRSEYYEHVNLIGHIYWGWTLPNVGHLKERIIDKYNKTQKVFSQIPPEERCRESSPGTAYRLWRHLQLEGHQCYMDEFKIAEDPKSLNTHNRLWQLMCEGANDPDIRYIE